MSTGGKVAIWIIATPIIGFALLVVITAIQEKGDKRSSWERIEQACQKEFGRAETLVNDCKIRLGLEKMSERERDATERARRNAR